MTSPVSMQWDPADFRERIQKVLDAFLDEQAARLAPLGEDASRLITEARTSVRGGKRFRAAFCYWGYRAIRPEVPDEDALARACAALELLHASALVHDDYMDASDTRRGRPAAHRAFEAEHRAAGWRGRPDQYGAAAAILLGDLLLGWAEELLRRCGLPVASVVPALEVFDLCRTEVIAGQFLDVSVQARAHADVDTAMTVLRYKSAKYSIERPLHVGAALAGATPAQLEDLSRFGLPLGEAFQLRDDLLGVFGDPATTGKPAGDDLVEGKRTVLVALALDGTDREAARRLDAALGTDLDEAAVADLRDIIDRSGAHAQVEEVIGALAERAVAALDTPTVDDAARGVLRDLAAAATQRTV
ncbi:polyprenyl synthetase family protein [Nocardioides sp. Soil777]|uniref:polyprenyl synthetase family protein n=1 Tax=Nocardioides sp. Soil777 TaxID=1736409 RepID=UPI001F332503|nr:polyprenyl synthetase family protein [Nocardioides sp. Soil777]